MAVAIALADEDGLGGLSMRRIAAELGVATMSLYPRVRGNEELLVLMLDAVFARFPPPTPPPGANWRVRVELLAHTRWACYQRHPWSPGLMSMSRPQNAPHGMLHTEALPHTEALLRAFAGFGLDSTTVMHAAVTVAGRRRLPLLTAIGEASEIDMDLNSLLEVGLGRLLDGFAVWLDGLGSPPSR